MSWTIEVNSYGSVETAEVEAATIMEAVENGLIELGHDGSDEGTLTIKVSGAAA